MADAIGCACEQVNSVLDYLATLRICEVRHCFELLGVAHMEVLGGVLVFILMQFTKFTLVLMLAILLAYGIFYLWDTFFPEISQLGRRGMKMFRNVRTSANLPPFASDVEETPGEYQIRPRGQQYTTGMITPPNMPMLLPMVQSKNLRTTSLQTDRRRQEEESRRGSRGRGHSSYQESQETDRKHRKERPNWRSANSEVEREHPSTSKKAHHGASGGGESKRMSNAMKIPTVTSGVVDTRRIANMTSDQLKRLPNITSGESRRSTKMAGGANESRKLHHITSGEMADSRRIPKITSNATESRWLPRGEVVKEARRIQQITSNTNESRRLPTVTSGEGKETRRSSHPQAAGESRRTSNNQRDGAGGGGESRSRRSAEKSNPAQGRRQEEQSKQRRSNNGHSGVTKRQFPEDHFERLKLENREFQARRLQASGAAFRQSLSNPTSEGALLTKQENFIDNHRPYDRRDAQRSTRSSNPNKDANHRHRAHHRLPNPVL
ncbi:uncharacterized protein LOC120452578 [Drosophila santomea]|uniref:uncharacterized protein LOC120452578 n=1 Tax=Drosophila santomea TaxID=129105 RepID=UPI001954134B|nr:uncharacterized protein LOC120452578 [Drosophila santomea]XP_039492796.1 uncharacterized protein LOC120452578 [Drosophila santomea]